MSEKGRKLPTICANCVRDNGVICCLGLQPTRINACIGDFGQWKCSEFIRKTDTGNWFANGIVDAIKTANGGKKNDAGKPPITLLDRDFLEGTAQVMAFGAVKYGKGNWKTGFAHSRLADAAMRHIIAWASGEDIDPESGLPHIDHASASLNMLRGNQRLHPELDDRK